MRSRFDSEAVYFWRNEYRRCGGEKSVQGKCFGAAKPEIHLRPASMLAIHRHTTHLCDTGLLIDCAANLAVQGGVKSADGGAGLDF